MNQDLGLTPQIYGFAAGILFVSYTAFEIPSNIILAKVGARIWIARIMVTWGIVGMATAFVYDRSSLYVLRFALGVAEAGFSPGIIFFLTLWFPAEERASAITLYLIGNPISVVIGAPLSTALLGLRNGVSGCTDGSGCSCWKGRLRGLCLVLPDAVGADRCALAGGLVGADGGSGWTSG